MIALHATFALMEATPSGTLPRSLQSPGVIALPFQVGASQRRMLNLQSLNNDGESPHLRCRQLLPWLVEYGRQPTFIGFRRLGVGALETMHMLIPNARFIEPVLVTPMKLPEKSFLLHAEPELLVALPPPLSRLISSTATRNR